MKEIKNQLVPYVPNPLDRNEMKNLMKALEGPAVNNKNSQ